MGLTYTRVSGGEGSWGQIRFKVFDVLYDNSYPTGGEVLSPAMIGLQNIVGSLQIGVKDATSGGVMTQFVPGATPKLMALRSAGGTVTGSAVVKGGALGEAIGINPDGNTGVLSKAAATDRTIPIATLLGGTLSVAQGAMAEVANTTDLSLVQVRVMFIGN